MASVFLSYDHDDAALAKPLATALEKAGHIVWFDRHIQGGAEYSRKIEQALDEANAVVVLWSTRSLESAWVRDEAAAGRDRGKLVPLSIGDVSPPMGFRQFQTIKLGAWTGRGRVPHLAEVLQAIESKAGPGSAPPQPADTGPKPPRPSAKPGYWLAAATLAFVIVIAAGAWSWLHRDGMPIVQVVAADGSSGSQAAASDLYVKLGSLAQVGDGKWQLVDGSVASHPDLQFRTSERNVSGRSVANLILLDGRRDNLLWSHELAFPTEQEADLKQQLSMIAGRVLGCALESRNQGGLSTDLLKTFLDACASLADLSGDDYGRPADQLRKIVNRVPNFEPGWSRLVMAESTAIGYAKYTPAEASLKRQLKADANRARTAFPNLPELAIAEVRLRDKVDFSRDIDVLSKAVDRAPANASLLAELSAAFMNVGRMSDAINSARRAAELDPLSPGGTTVYIMTLAHGGQIDLARTELAKAERLWAGTGSLRDAQAAFHMRYGDPAIAMKLDPEGYNTAFYQRARSDPSPSNIARLKSGIDEFRPKVVRPDQVGWAIQSLGEFGLVDDVYYWLGRLPNDQVADISYILFRPSLASARRDPRFMSLAKRIGLVDYWQKSGTWPDYCARPGILYDCKQEAAKLN